MRSPCKAPGCKNISNRDYCYRHQGTCPDCGARIVAISARCQACANIVTTAKKKNKPNLRRDGQPSGTRAQDDMQEMIKQLEKPRVVKFRNGKSLQLPNQDNQRRAKQLKHQQA